GGVWGGAPLLPAAQKAAPVPHPSPSRGYGAADLRSDSVTQEILNNVFGDCATKFPDGLKFPDHWDTQTKEWHEPDPKFQAWLDAGAPPGKPLDENPCK
ncbi:MAG: hypothetical protein AAGD13_23465, partial [Pseudomonadota bacterium]